MPGGNSALSITLAGLVDRARSASLSKASNAGCNAGSWAAKRCLTAVKVAGEKLTTAGCGPPARAGAAMIRMTTIRGRNNNGFMARWASRLLLRQHGALGVVLGHFDRVEDRRVGVRADAQRLVLEVPVLNAGEVV